ncbi:UDP-N-acetylglucosamine 2-epimerase [Polynucleobacter sp. UB-Raua-W9]|uniref:UDP-N-acetylglucosamine 2-epimerase n=1 Tax=Polynucleobacter sp. UB-Raua-W9 TaxID=1819736 RepID=UPI001BFD216E|nr:UDP-N-acetylglucosamine 2-epimerase [Polynucleobacter sp. UB-Raua-W9]QWD72723.1 UDP-N-acetylglucosamine 2-epimerase (hydrolyzing) [Polynucleobacter sp. UB-Raua-W9]
MTNLRKILFVTGTRADFGKLKPLMLRLSEGGKFDTHIFITGMHMLAKYGYTCEEVERNGFKKIYKFINQSSTDRMDQVLSKTIAGLSDYVQEIQPDLIIIHGDRVEALAGATVGSLNNILTGHIEGGEVSGTVDELIRHAVTKLSHVHFVANSSARTRLMQLGESNNSIHMIGSPDIDVMNSASLPSIDMVRERYQIAYEKYSIAMFHPVTTEIKLLKKQVSLFVDCLINSGKSYVVIYPNNDTGSEIILNEYSRLDGLSQFKLFPSMRFEYFLVLLKNADFVIGNSSAGVREAPHYGVPAINIGTRQHNRVKTNLVINADFDEREMLDSIMRIEAIPRIPESFFGDGDSALRFYEIVSGDEIWSMAKQKYFVDLDS